MRMGRLLGMDARRKQLLGYATYTVGAYLVRRAVRKRVDELLRPQPRRRGRVVVPVVAVAAVGAAVGAVALARMRT